jgi:hypothetical protein
MPSSDDDYGRSGRSEIDDYSGGYNKPGSDEYTTGSGRNNTDDY